MFKKFLVSLMSLALIINYLPTNKYTVSAHTTVDPIADSKIADPSTIDDWKDYFGSEVDLGDGRTGITTEYVGGVWTDKSVFKDDTDINAAFSKYNPEIIGGVKLSDPENFLAVLSTISSTKQITGFTYLPTDTIFVLDLSGSMQTNELQRMVDSTNKAITELLALNRYNRVGVIAYSDSSTILLEIDRYITTKTATDNKGTSSTTDDEEYNVYIEYTNSQFRTAQEYEYAELNVNWNSVADGYSYNYWNSSNYYSFKYYLKNTAWNDDIKEAANNLPNGFTLRKSDWEKLVDSARNLNSKQAWIDWLTDNAKVSALKYCVTGSDNVVETATRSTGGGTYTQVGIHDAAELFKNKSGDTVIDTGLIQGGTKRIPITVLMTDGAPTYGNSDYIFQDRTSYNLGNGSNVNYELAFLTQLTATYSLSVIEDIYQREGRFYTLGLGVTENQAASVLDPANNTYTNTTLNNYWNKYKSEVGDQEIFKYNTGWDKYTTVKRLETAYDAKPDETTVDMTDILANFPYADQYFPASDADDLVKAFDDIVQEIIVQSKYYPTLVSQGKYDMDGYVTIIDELGEFMEVKDIKGIVYGNTLFSGKAIVEAMYGNKYGNAGTWTPLGWELVYSIKERLDHSPDDYVAGSGTDSVIEVTNDVAIQLLKDAWQDGQIHCEFTDANNNNKLDSNEIITSFSNYISYYVNDKGQYLGFHDKDHTSLSYPKDAKYIGYSYLFQGTVTKDNDGSIEGSEMMHIILQVYEEIGTGHQTVTWRVPASLVPLALYEIDVTGNQLTDESLNNITYTYDTPIRAVYEIGLNEDITPINMKEIMEAPGQHHHDAPNGAYYLYSNRWGDGHGVAKLDPYHNKATVAHYNPSVENERYYFAEDTIIYENTGENTYTAYTGTTKPTGENYYHPIKIVKANADGTSPSLDTNWLNISEAVLQNSKKTDDGNNHWYIEKGTIYQQETRDRVDKKSNPTDTLEYVDYPVITRPSQESTDYEVFLFHGNNGRFTIEPATGIKISKEAHPLSIDTNLNNETFKFVVTLTTEATVSPKVTNEKYVDIAHTLSNDKKTITFYLKHGETAYITGLPSGTTYTVTEDVTHNNKFALTNVLAPDSTINSDLTVTGTTTLHDIKSIKFSNTEKNFKGDLQVIKTVTHPYGQDYTIPSNKVFDITVKLTGDNLINKKIKVQGTQRNIDNTIQQIDEELTLKDNTHTFTFRFADDDSVTIKDLPEGTEYTVTEGTLPTGFELTTSESITNGEIISNRTQVVELFNEYSTTIPTDILVNLEVSKELVGTAWNNHVFNFKIEKYDFSSPAGWKPLDNSINNALSISKSADSTNNNTEKVSVGLTPAQLGITSNELETHYYKVSEIQGNIPGITYDPTSAYFRVVVSDADMDGSLEFEVVEVSNTDVQEITNTNVDNDTETTNSNVDNVTETANTKVYKVTTKQFTNRYHSTIANINIQKKLKNTSGKPIQMRDFVFGLYTDESCTTPYTDVEGNQVTVTPDINGDAVIPVTYVKNSFTGKNLIVDNENTSYSTNESNIDYNSSDTDNVTKTSIVDGTTTVTKTFVDTFYLKEIIPSTPITGMTYDNNVIKVDITVNMDEEIHFKATRTVTVTAPASNTTSVDSETDTDEVQEGTNESEDPNALELEAEERPVDYTTWVEVGTPTYTPIENNTTSSLTLTNTVTYTLGTETLTQANFTNKYEVEPTSIKIQGTKNLSNKLLEANKYEFELYETNNTFALDSSAVLLERVKNGVNNDITKFLFSDIEYSTVGTRYYVVKETIPDGATEDNNYTLNGITYDTTLWHITVHVSVDDTNSTSQSLEQTTVEENEQEGDQTDALPIEDDPSENDTDTEDNDTQQTNKAQLKAQVTINENGGSGTSIVFNNTYTITEGTSTTLSIYKSLSGRALNKDDFTFYVYDLNDVTVENGSITIREGASPIRTATNAAYNTVQMIDGTYVYTGTVQFTPIEYTKAETYNYIILEDTSISKGGITYDAIPYVYATVNVVDDGDGTLSIGSTTYDNTNRLIENTYRPNPIVKEITAKKLYASNDPFAPKEVTEDFKFALYQTDKNYQITDYDTTDSNATTPIKVITGTKSETKGYVDINIPLGSTYIGNELMFTHAGDYYFTLQELAGNTPTISYDFKIYNIMVVVTDDGNGTLNAIPHIYHNGTEVTDTFGNNNSYDFINLYYPQNTRAGVVINKTVTNDTGIELSKDGFRFGLYTNYNDAIAHNENYVKTVLTDINGAAYMEIEYTDTDVPSGEKQFKYYLTEMYADKNNDLVKDEIQGMHYDTTVYEVTINVGYTDKILGAEVTSILNLTTNSPEDLEAPVNYLNVYDLEDAVFSITGTKVFTGKPLKDDEFKFALYEATVETDGTWTKGAQIGTNVGNIGSTITFPEFTYNTIGTHYYIAKEVIPSQATAENRYTVNGYTYDPTEYQIIVNVTDGNQGKLEASIYTINGYAPSATNSITFHNTFTPVPVEISIIGTKTLQNGTLEANDFEFELYKANENYVIDGAKITTVTNTADATNNFTFSALPELQFTQPGKHYFVVKEVIPTGSELDPTITYSTSSYNILIDVTQKDNGQLEAKMYGPSGTNDHLVIENTYSSKQTSTQVTIEKTVINTTGVDIDVTAKDFTFGLYTDEECTNEYTVNNTHVTVSPEQADTFDDAILTLSYTDKDFTNTDFSATQTYTYYLKELENTALTGIKYDKSVYKLDVELKYVNNELTATSKLTKIKDSSGANITPSEVTKAEFHNSFEINSTSIEITGTKVYDGWGTNTTETFTIELYKTDASGNYAASDSVKVGQTTVSKNTSNFAFKPLTGQDSPTLDNLVSELTFTKSGTYYFVVRELNGGLTLFDENKHGIVYSGTQYVVQVTVAPNADKTDLVATQHIYRYGHEKNVQTTSEASIRFTNTDIQGETTIDIIGIKALYAENDTEKTNNLIGSYDQFFDFEIYEATVNGNTWTRVDSKTDTTIIDPLFSTVNREKTEDHFHTELPHAHNIEFIGVPLKYDNTEGNHTYHFIIEELDTKNPTIGYDDTIYCLEINAVFSKDDQDNYHYTVSNVKIDRPKKDPIVITSVTTLNNRAIIHLSEHETSFTNTYIPYGKTTSINLDKILVNETGVDLSNETFNFELFENKECTKRASLDTDGYVTTTESTQKAIWDNISHTADIDKVIKFKFTDKDVSLTPHTYYLKEIIGDKNGMEYSEQMYRIDVTVQFDLTGTKPDLVATPVIYLVNETGDISQEAIVSKATFTNTYQLNPATLTGFEGTKVLKDHMIHPSDYRFDLYKATVNTDGTWTKGELVEHVDNTEEKGAVDNDYNGFKFSDLTFTKADKYYYIIEEHIPEEVDKLPAITYDTTKYYVTVDVTDNNNGALEAKVINTVKDVERTTTDTVEKIEFTNVYNPSTTLSFTGKKEILHRPWNNSDEFTFKLYQTDENYNNAVEVDTNVVTIDNKTFDLTTTIEGTIVDANKVAQPNKHYFMIKEVSGNDIIMKYDKSEYHIEVTTTDDLYGNLIVENISITKDDAKVDEIVFTNEYRTSSASVMINGTKVLEDSISGRELTAREFTFELCRSDSNWTVGEVINTSKNDKKGKFSFNLSVKQNGTYYYIVKERKGDNPIITYDETIHRVKVVVTGSGALNKKAKVYYVYENGVETRKTSTDQFGELVKFVNQYNDTNLSIDIIKKLTTINDVDHTLGGFKFTLTNVTKNKSYDVISDNDGNAKFVIPFDENNIGQTHIYELREVPQNEIGMEYDDTVYTFNVTVTVDTKNNELVTVLQNNNTVITDPTFTFHNKYTGTETKPDQPVDPDDTTTNTDVPGTSDNTNILLYLGTFLSSISVMIFLLIKRKKKMI